MRNKVIETQRTLIKAAAKYHQFGETMNPQNPDDVAKHYDLRDKMEQARDKHQIAVQTYRKAV